MNALVHFEDYTVKIPDSIASIADDQEREDAINEMLCDKFPDLDMSWQYTSRQMHHKPRKKKKKK